MEKWLKQNLTLSVMITLLLGYGGGAAVASRVIGDVDRLNKQMESMQDKQSKIENDVLRLHLKLDYALQNSNNVVVSPGRKEKDL